jgi:hypothetical protein
MKANSTHISLETAKLLKDCELESKLVWCKNEANRYYIPAKPITREKSNENAWSIPYPAYTWQEILWEYPQEFFGEDAYDTFGGYCHTCRFTVDILDFLQDKEYDKADKYFRDNCILIK